jgi:hypothetical protein
MSTITLKLALHEAEILWKIVDGAIDAGACEDGLTPEESEVLNDISFALLKHRDKLAAARDARRALNGGGNG